MSQDGTQSVLIIGAGPTGMTAALELARFGIQVRIIEKTPEPATTSRAVGVQARTLELLEQRGLAAPLVEAGNPALAASVYGGGKRVFRQDFSRIDSRYNYLLPFSYSNVSEPTLKRSVLPASSSIASAREPLDQPSRFGLTSTPQAFYVRR